MKLSQRKGVSEIVAALILLFIVSAVGVGLYSITMTNTNTQMSQVRENAQSEIERAYERFKITSVTNSSKKDFRVSVLNYGDIETKIVDIYANGETVSSFTPEKGDGTILIDEIIMFEFTISQSHLSEPIEFTIVSEKGTAYSMSWSPS